MSDEPLEETELPWYRGRAFQLFVVLMTVYAVGTFIGSDGPGIHLINVLLLVSMFLAVKSITGSKRAVRTAMIIFLAGFAGETIATQVFGREVIVWDYWTNLVFFGAVLVFLIAAVVKADKVNTDTVFAAADVFMLMGIVWAFAFMLVHNADPAAFSLRPEDLTQAGSALLHFSFTTLTTVGYGSISPMSDMARMLSDIEALIAQLYLAVVVARLVSLQIEHSRKSGAE